MVRITQCTYPVLLDSTFFSRQILFEDGSMLVFSLHIDFFLNTDSLAPRIWLLFNITQYSSFTFWEQWTRKRCAMLQRTFCYWCSQPYYLQKYCQYIVSDTLVCTYHKTFYACENFIWICYSCLLMNLCDFY